MTNELQIQDCWLSNQGRQLQEYWKKSCLPITNTSFHIKDYLPVVLQKKETISAKQDNLILYHNKLGKTTILLEMHKKLVSHISLNLSELQLYRMEGNMGKEDL